MKKIFIILSFFIFCIINATSDQELFLQASSNFLEGKFDKALKNYEQIKNKNSATWHNIGNCYFNENNNLKALICWKKAEKNATFSQLKQLFKSENTVLEKFSCHTDNIFIETIKLIILGLPKHLLQIILLIFLILFLTTIYKNIYKKEDQNNKKQYFMILFSILFILFIIIIKYNLEHKKQAVIINQNSKIYVGPETTFPQKDLLQQGCIVNLLEKKDGMTKIKNYNCSGWTLNENIEIIE